SLLARLVIAALVAVRFFFVGVGAPRDLHSFPTRRSSDLPESVYLDQLARMGSRSQRYSAWALADGSIGDKRERYRRRKSTRLNSSHVKTSYAVFCLKN